MSNCEKKWVYVINSIETNKETIASGARTKELITKYGFNFKKSYGQNFLIDTHVLNKIINSAELTKDDYVIEIGPGIGSLTQELCSKAGKVTAIEIDKKLIPILNESLSEFENLDIINEDVLKVDLHELIKNSGYGSAKVVANLPYYITTPIIMGLLENKVPIKSIIVMVQKEVAARMQSKPGTKDYGSLSLAVQYRADAYLVANVPQNCFMPRPNVDSAVIRLTPLETPKVEVRDEVFFFEIIKSAFSMRRKTLVNCFFNSGICNSKEEIAKVLVECGLDEKVRGETLGLVEFSKLAEKFLEQRGL